MKTILLSLAIALALGLGTSSVCAQSGVANGIGIDQQLGRFVPVTAAFSDENGNPVTLGGLVTKPTILILVYYQCPNICTPLMMNVGSLIGKMALRPGADYNIVTISVDEDEGPAIAAEKKAEILKGIKEPISATSGAQGSRGKWGQAPSDGSVPWERGTAANVRRSQSPLSAPLHSVSAIGPGVPVPGFPEASWRFLTGNPANINAVAASIGFRFKRQGGGIMHAATLVILAPGGRITRYITGASYLPADVELALRQAARGEVTQTRPGFEGSMGPVRDDKSLLSFCYAYDPQKGRNVLNVTRIAGFATIIFAFGLAGFVALRAKGRHGSAKP